MPSRAPDTSFRPDAGALPVHAPRQPLTAADLWAWTIALVLMVLAWRLSSVLLLVFAGALLAIGLRRLTQPLEQRFKLPSQGALAIVVIGLAVLLAGGIWLMGAGVADQLQSLRETLPLAWRALQKWLATFGWGRWLIETLSAAPIKPDDWQQMAGVFTGTLNATVAAAGALVLVVVLAIYLAADARAYQRGLLRLTPPARRPAMARALDAATHDLARWLLGQGVSMLAVGALTAIGLMLIGMPLVVSLSLIAALLEFVPYFGPVVTGVLVVAVAFTRGEDLALWAAIVCLAVQQIENHVVQPLAQRWAVRLPPVLGIVSVLVFGLLFGLAGVLLAMPLMVLCVALVGELYLHESADTGAPAALATPRAPRLPDRRTRPRAHSDTR
jgi:predicted PurR-regulated permease PerM